MFTVKLVSVQKSLWFLGEMFRFSRIKITTLYGLLDTECLENEMQNVIFMLFVCFLLELSAMYVHSFSIFA